MSGRFRTCFGLFVLWAFALVVSVDAAPSGNKRRVRRHLQQQFGSTSNFITGHLGNIGSPQGLLGGSTVAIDSATNAFRGILDEHFGATGIEEINPSDQPIVVDKQGNSHMRFQQYLEGYPVEGSGLVVHFDSDGLVFAANGEFTPGNDLPEEPMNLDCDSAMDVAQKQSGIVGDWSSEPCVKAAVLGDDGVAHKAYKRVLHHDTYKASRLFSSPMDGRLLAIHPLTHGALEVKTYDCNSALVVPYENIPKKCDIVSKSSKPISNSDEAVSAAHNYAIATYNFYKQQFNRNSIDNKGLPMTSLVHSCLKYGSEKECPLVNAFWDNLKLRMTYGDGDGKTTGPFSLALDVVAHELTHGVTQFSSGLLYSFESGALNEAMSDIHGAAVERTFLNKSISDTWYLGEDIFISSNRYATRNMANPSEYKQPDYYPERLLTSISYDNGGVHTNSGIANLAFALLVQGGYHPRAKTNFSVPALETDFDASILAAIEIFYYTNTACLTPRSTFRVARECSILMAKNSHKNNVRTAWDAVGLGSLELVKSGERIPLGSMKQGQIKTFVLNRRTLPGELVTCVVSTTANGDLDFFVQFDREPDPFWYSSSNECNQLNGVCTTRVVKKKSTAVISVLAYKTSNRGVLKCEQREPCKRETKACSDRSDCCQTGGVELTCDGPTRGNGVCKRCRKEGRRCDRSTECCKGYKCKGGNCRSRK